jgi:DnaJ-class molecular chaperone
MHTLKTRLLQCCRHPDKNDNSVESTTKFQEISAAYAALTQANDQRGAFGEDFFEDVDVDIHPFFFL